MSKLNFKILLFVLLLFNLGCSKEELSNKSAMYSIPVGTSDNVIIPYYTLDLSGTYLFIFIRDLSYNRSSILKINIGTQKVEKQIIFEGTENTTAPIMYDNIIVTDKNELICSFHNFYYTKQINMKFDQNLNILKADTTANSWGGNYGRTRFISEGSGKLTGLYGHRDTSGGKKKWFWRFQQMDEELNILSTITDTSSFYGTGPIAIANFNKTSDGGYIYNALDQGGGAAMILEKRDANFNLIWRIRYGTSILPVSLIESNGNFLSYCGMNNGVSTLVFDANGNFVSKQDYVQKGAIINKSYEPTRKTDKGQLLMSMRAIYENNPLAATGLLVHADADGKALTYRTFGGNNVLGSGLLKVSFNKYILFYVDNAFVPEGKGLPRIVINYVNEEGELIQ